MPKDTFETPHKNVLPYTFQDKISYRGEIYEFSELIAC